ncbi:DUF4365 domain-containing protein [Streptomyces griseofuscus]|uniref:DUF4365 domain-containing protein n=1 Tax=Streptomyces griseofuscus TaxID=146922 RepID=UPI0036BB61E9
MRYSYARLSVGGCVGDPGTWQQEQISLAYLSAVATQAGVTTASWNVDKDAVDITLKRRGLLVEFQMKCSYSPTLLGDGETYAYDLDIRAYNILRDAERSAAGYLGLVIVPADLDDWLVHDEESLLMRCTGYYARIQDCPSVTNEATTRIHLPKKQRIDASGLNDAFTYAHDRLFLNRGTEGVQ